MSASPLRSRSSRRGANAPSTSTRGRGMPEVALYLFDGSNLFHAGRFAHRDELVDELASFVAVRGTRGIVVFDGVGEDREIGALAVRFAPDADTVLERL